MPAKVDNFNSYSMLHPDVWQACTCYGVTSRPYSGGGVVVSLLKVETSNLGKRWKGNGCKGTGPAPWLPPVVSLERDCFTWKMTTSKCIGFSF